MPSTKIRRNAIIQPWGLVFVEKNIEAQYTTEMFRSVPSGIHYIALGVFALLQSVFLVFLGNEHLLPIAATFLFEIVSMAALLRLQYMADVQQARRIFGHVLAAATMICWTAALLWVRAFPPATISAPMAMLDAAFWGSSAIAVHALTLPRGSHLMWLASALLGMLLLPEWSVLGRPWETLFMWGALLAGEAAGYAIQRRKRVAWSANRFK